MTKVFMYKKCKTCPYKLGYIKCIVFPCRKCIGDNRKDHPFPITIIKKEKEKRAL
jgi:hypothetical protein